MQDPLGLLHFNREVSGGFRLKRRP